MKGDSIKGEMVRIGKNTIRGERMAWLMARGGEGADVCGVPFRCSRLRSRPCWVAENDQSLTCLSRAGKGV